MTTTHDWGRHDAARDLLLTCYTPKHALISQLANYKDGVLHNISRQEAIERGLSAYVSRRLNPLDKIFPLAGGGYGVVRHTANGLTGGQIRWQKRHQPIASNTTATNEASA